MQTSGQDWAQEEFGGAALGDARRVSRLVRLAASALQSPSGTVTSVVRSSAEREGAFRLLESSTVSASAVAAASHRAALGRAQAHPWVYVAMDGSSLSLADPFHKRDIGAVGAWRQHGRGLLVTSALVVSPDGSPLGLCGQRWWARTKRARTVNRCYAMQTETRHGVELLEEVHARFTSEAPGVVPWFQLDRGYDCWAILQRARRFGMRITVRAAYNRCVREHRHARKRFLFKVLQRAPLLGHYDLEVPARGGRPARVATMDVRACPVTIDMRVGSKRREYVPLYAVSAIERRRNKPLRWTLLTSAPVDCLSDALGVINGYAARWRIEEFHRAWKSGGCNVEDTQLRGRETIIKWATILAAVAARATRLAHLARERPTAPATEELTRYEIDAAIALLRPKGVKLGHVPTLGEAVRWIADLGGYTGKSSGGPPGATTIGRGLEKVAVIAAALENMEGMR